MFILILASMLKFHFDINDLSICFADFSIWMNSPLILLIPFINYIILYCDYYIGHSLLKNTGDSRHLFNS